MKKQLVGILVLISPFVFSQYQGRVGINTDKPETELHVNGTMRAYDLLLDQTDYNAQIEKIPKLTPSERYSFLLKSAAKQRITTYNTQSGSVNNNFPAPFGIITYKISVTDAEDWVNEFDTKINSTKYLAIVNSFNYNLPVVHDGTNIDQRRRAPVAQVFTRDSGGTWKIKADYHGFAHRSGNTQVGQWEITLMVFDRQFARVFPSTVDMNGSATGTAATALIQ